MARDNAAAVGASLASAWLAGVAALDIAIPGPTIVLSVLFALAPLIACTVLSPASTSVFAAAAIGLTVASGWWDRTWDSPQHLVRVIDVVLVSGAAVAVAAVRVRREQVHERVAAIAEVAQRAVLPKLPPRVDGVVTGARYLSAAEDTVVGGDLYDCYYSDQQARFLIADVRGKGIGAVEQAARVIRAFRQAAARQSNLPAVAADMTNYLEPFFEAEEFATALLVDASDPAALRLVSCGHPPALMVRADGLAELVEAPPGLPLGLLTGLGIDYPQTTVPWGPGDRLLLYTDGLSEARDRGGEFLSVLPMAPLLRSATVDSALDAVLATVTDYVPGGELSDDLAVVLLEHTPLDRTHATSKTAQGHAPVSVVP